MATDCRQILNVLFSPNGSWDDGKKVAAEADWEIQQHKKTKKRFKIVMSGKFCTAIFFV